MINLIPPNGQEALKHEYVLRVVTVCSLFLSGVFFVGVGLLVPTYLLTSAQLTGAQDQSSDMEKTKQDFDIAFGEIRYANTIMSQLRSIEVTTSMHDVIATLVALAPEGVTFSTFTAHRELGTLREITMQGKADKRRTLVDFKAALESSDMFAEAHVPISDLAREVDLPFAIVVVVRDPASVTQ